MNNRASLIACVMFAVGLGVCGVTGAEDVRPHAGMLRYPDVSASHIVFLYANDLWLVARSGGVASLLASPDGQESFPRFSPDGRSVAFIGNYDGNRDLYTVPVSGGVPYRVTYHPVTEYLCDWTPDGELVFYTYGMGVHPRTVELYRVAAAGGMPHQLPVPYGAAAAVDASGQWLAYTPNTRDARSWKRYRGGMASDIWLFHLTDHASRRLTDWEGTDSLPMWQGEMVYYLSDGGPEHRLNIWVVSTSSGERRQVTSYADQDVKWPAIGPGPDGHGEIVFQKGAGLYLLDLASDEVREVEVVIPGDRPRIRPHTVDAGELVFSLAASSTGKRAVVGARGDIWTLPAKKGSPRNLTRSGGVADRDPAWSPDGQWIAYLSDASGEYQLYLRQSDGRGEARQLTQLEPGFYFAPTWSPDSKHIAFWDQGAGLYVHTLEGDVTREVDRDPWANRSPLSWSHDSAWLTYARGGANPNTRSIWLCHLADGTTHQVTSGMYYDYWPTFDREGKLLFFTSLREFSDPIYEDVGNTFVYSHTGRLFAIPLQADAASPLAPESDEEEWGEEDEEAEDDEDAAKKKRKKRGAKDDQEEDAEEGAKDEPEPLVIDLEGLERRVIELPAERGRFGYLTVNDDNQLVYLRSAPPVGKSKATIMLLDLDDEEELKLPPGLLKMGVIRPDQGDDRKEKTVLEDVDGFTMTADGTKLLVWKKGRMAIIDARPKQEMKDVLATDGLRTVVDPREEWRQIFTEAWRLDRDFFYDPNMHGVDWEKVRWDYEAMLDDCASREDVSYVIREMIAELNVGHAYYFGGDVEEAPRVSVGLLGCDFELADGAYRIAHIVEGAAWDADARGPLSQPGLDVHEGDYLLAVNGAPVDATLAPWAAFQGLADTVVTVTVSDKPVLDDTARDVVVKLAGSEAKLRYWSWVEANRAYVAEKSGGKVGYIYVPDTGIRGQNHLLRQFFGQTTASALIIDERWNGGGQIPTRFIELLNRPVANYWALRHGNDWTWPPDAHHGPKCMLINGLAGSGGDYFPFYFRATGLGKLIGTRTWGGLVGIQRGPRLVDGAVTTVPAFAFYETDGTWGIEGHGVDPDIEVVDDPALMVDGGDPQLDAAIELMLAEIEAHPYVKPERPPYPDRSGMGIAPEDY